MAGKVHGVLLVVCPRTLHRHPKRTTGTEEGEEIFDEAKEAGQRLDVSTGKQIP